MRYTNLPKFSELQILKCDFSKMFLYCFLYFLKYVGDKYGVRGSRFNRFVGRSRNHPKSIAICPGIKNIHFGIIKSPKSPKEYTKKQRKTNESPKFVAVFWDLLDTVLGPIRPERQYRIVLGDGQGIPG